MVGHEGGTRRKQGDVAAALFHQLELIGFYALAQIVVADVQVSHLGHDRRVLYARNLPVAPVFQSLGGGGVVAVAVDDQTHVLSPEFQTDDGTIASPRMMSRAVRSKAACVTSWPPGK